MNLVLLTYLLNHGNDEILSLDRCRQHNPMHEAVGGGDAADVSGRESDREHRTGEQVRGRQADIHSNLKITTEQMMDVSDFKNSSVFELTGGWGVKPPISTFKIHYFS